jgi:hypothetical protein
MRYFLYYFVLSQGSRYLNHLVVSQLLLTPWNIVLPEQLTVPQLVKKFPTVCGTRRFITIFTSVSHLSLILSHSYPVYSPYPTFLRLILILSANLLLCLPSDIFYCGFPPKPSMHLFYPPSMLHVPPISSLF